MSVRNKWIFAAALALSSATLTGAARADVYHSVENGDTLATVAARYKVSVEALRQMNGLTNAAPSDNLPAMLLRVPTDAPSAARPVANAAPVASTRAVEKAPARGYGKVTTLAVHTLKEGETLQDVAALYNSSPDAIRAKTGFTGNPTVGQRLLVPQQTQTFGGATQMGGANISAETYAPISVPATDVKFKPPIYQGATPKVSARKTSVATRRGPTVLSSRGYSASARFFPDGSRVLGQSEEAPTVGRTPQPRLRVAEAPAAPSSKMAKVAKIAKTGARIRRLPEAEAATLYHCSTGTELAVMQQQGMWSAILMSDRSTGWVPTKYLSFSGSTVDISTQVITGAAARQYSYTNSRNIAISGKFSSDNPMVAQALTWLGTRYVYGGEGRNGIDCSSLVQHSFAACGVRLPRTAAEQARVGTPIDPSNLQAGDRLYFSASGRRVDHTGLYMGNGLFVHASGSGRGVIVSKLSDRRNWNIFVGARR